MFTHDCDDPMHRAFAIAGDRLDREMADGAPNPVLAFAILAQDFTEDEKRRAVLLLHQAGGCNEYALEHPDEALYALLLASYEFTYGEKPPLGQSAPWHGGRSPRYRRRRARG